MFSYGKKENVIEFNKNKITQLTAPNGSGKSSIALILQEVLFNKNIKGIKKADILNRWSNLKEWNASLDFNIDHTNYVIKVGRSGAKSIVELIANGKDLSEHKVLDTYKKVQELLNLDFSIFSQLTYQSSIDLLEFLKATDTNRKKFLINLFNLEKYIKIGEAIKIVSNNQNKKLTLLQGELNGIDSFLKDTDISETIEFIDIPKSDENLIKKLALLEKEVEEYTETCKKIDKNNSFYIDVSIEEIIDTFFTMSMDGVSTLPKEYPAMKNPDAA